MNVTGLATPRVCQFHHPRIDFSVFRRGDALAKEAFAIIRRPKSSSIKGKVDIILASPSTWSH